MFDFEIINSVSFCVSYIMLVKFLENIKRETLFKVFILILIVDNFFFIFFRNYVVLSIYACSFIVFIYIYKKTGSAKKSLLIILSVLSTIQAIIMFYGSLFFLIYEAFNYNNKNLYDFIICLLLISTIFLITYFGRKDFIILYSNASKIMNLEILSKLVFILFLNIIIPSLPISKDKMSYSIISLTFFVFYILINLIFCKIINLESDNLKNLYQLDFFKKKVCFNNKKYDDLVILKHYYIKLFNCLALFIHNSDLIGLTNYFNKYITPINENLASQERFFNEIKGIDNEVIKLLLFEAVNRSANNKNIDFKIEIENNINEIYINEMDLFKMLSIFIDNAFEEVERQENGFIEMLVFSNLESFNFAIKNSLEFKSKEKKSNTHRGLDIAKKIASENENIFLQVKQDSTYYVQFLMVRNENL